MAAAVASAPGLSLQSRTHSDSNMVSTLPDPRRPSTRPSSMQRHVSAQEATHPDFNNEVATLSNKLINAINHQTTLDDTLAATQHELDSAKERVRELENQNREHNQMLATGMLVKRSDFEAENIDLRSKLAEERQLRKDADHERRKMEQELENLTKELFEQANQMVSSARQEREAVERRNEQLKAQVHDTESLLSSQQEQLAQLKSVLANVDSERGDEVDSNPNESTAPTTPSLAHHEHIGKLMDSLHLSPNSPSGAFDVTPSNPTSFSHLLQPVLRTDLQAYEDFLSLLQLTRGSSTPSSRAPSGSFGGLNVMGLSSLGNQTQSTPQQLSHSASTGSTASSLSTAPTVFSSPGTPSTPASAFSSVSSRDGSNSNSMAATLKETKFYKRVLAEDIEPTLRLDTAPGLSWLARRTVLNAICDGNLIVEPMPSSTRLYLFSCALCGESRKDDKYSRTHRFKASEAESAQRYPLCPYCLGRLRATCDFLGFLRMIRDGHWRTDRQEGEKSAWEESVRLREGMFWSRMGGGVVPAFILKESPRNSEGVDRPLTSVQEDTEVAEPKDLDLERQQTPEDAAGAEVVDVPEIKEEDVFHSTQKRVSIGKRVLSTEATPDYDQFKSNLEPSAVRRSEETPQTISLPEGDRRASDPGLGQRPSTPQPQDDSEKSKDLEASPGVPSAPGLSRGSSRLAINIPGAFD